MFRSITRMTWWMAAAMAMGLFCSAEAQAKKPPPPDPASYTLVDLLGFPDNGYQSQAMLITNRDGNGDVLIGGVSRLHPDPEGPSVFHPALWHVDISGVFPSTDPVDMGLPDWARELTPMGINRFGVTVGRTQQAKLQDENGNWVFPSYVQLPGLPGEPYQPYQELPAIGTRNTSAEAINDSGVVVGFFVDGLADVGGMWKVEADGSITGPRNLGWFYPLDINNYGVMAGVLWTGEYEFHPVVAWVDENDVLQIPTNTSPPPVSADVAALNDYDVGDPLLTVVGTCYNAEGAARGYAWKPWDYDDPTTVMGTLGGRDSHAFDVNRQGEIVGLSWYWHRSPEKRKQLAFLFKDGQMRSLNSLADVGDRNLFYVYAINDDGDIVGNMGVPRAISQLRAFLLRPIPQ